MPKTLNRSENYRSYIRSVLRMYALMDAGLFEGDEADALREQMVEPWYALSKEERLRMDGLVMDLNELRESRKNSVLKPLPKMHEQEGLLKLREFLELKQGGRFDEALEHLRKWQSLIASPSVWHLRGSCWYFMSVPEVAVEFYREAARLAPENEQFRGVYLMALKKTDFEEAKKVADEILSRPEGHDLGLITYAADVEIASINDDGGAPAVERVKRITQILENVTKNLLENVMSQVGPGQIGPLVAPVLGMAGMLLSNCYAMLGDTQQAFGLLSFLISMNPGDPLLYAARGKLNYPRTRESVKDLERSIELGMPMSWPFVWIATYHLEKGDQSACKKTCLAGLKRSLAPRIKSELLELLAIAEVCSGAPEAELRELFDQAIRTDITNSRAVHNLGVFESLIQDSTRAADWRRESPLLDRNPERVEEKSFIENLQKDLAPVA